MKLRYLHIFLTLMLFSILTLSTTLVKNTFMVSVDPEAPILPDVPFDYDIDFPDHVIFGNWSFVDPEAVNNLISPEGATLGRVLFYDKKLSVSNELSCASCHKQEFAFADNKQFSDGINGAKTERNSPNLNDLAWASTFLIDPIFGFEGNSLFWDVRETNLEEMVLQPIVHEGELGKDMDVLMEKLSDSEYYAPLFEAAFGSSEITPEKVGNAIAQFVRSMSSFDSKFDQVMKGETTFSQEEQMGHDIFIESCGMLCHGDPHFGTSFPMNNGLDSLYEDIGAATWTENDADIGKFKSPGLRNIALTAPYMHDGRFETLEEVVDFYSDEVFPHPNSDFHWNTGDPEFTGFEFEETQKDALLKFLLTLTDNTYISHEKWSDPFPNSTGVSFLPLEEKVHIYPNPFSEKALLEFENPQSETYYLQISTVNGMVLKSYKTNANTFLLEKGNLLPGVYLLEIRKGNLKKFEKIVIK